MLRPYAFILFMFVHFGVTRFLYEGCTCLILHLKSLLMAGVSSIGVPYSVPFLNNTTLSFSEQEVKIELSPKLSV